MSCNITSMAQITNQNCGIDYLKLPEIDQCHEVCLMSLLFLYNNCVAFIPLDLDKQIKKIIQFCYIYGGGNIIH
jgi:hypothetical protein